jgi:lipooligosaccharide transport system ATP-binding protein
LEFLSSQNIPFESFHHRLLIYTRDGEALYRRIFKDFCPQGCTLRMTTLEDVFLKLTGRGLRE